MQFEKIPLSLNRKMVIASVNSNKKNSIHCLTKVDITVPRKKREEIFENSGIRISFNAYILRCFAEAIRKFPEMNSFIKGNKLILLKNINISLLVEREIKGEFIPEPVCIRNADHKDIFGIHNEIRTAQSEEIKELGSLTQATWIKFIPAFLFRLFIRIADRNIKMADKYGKIAITSPGMFLNSPSWFIPHGTATVLLVIGNIYTENYLNDSGELHRKELLNLTFSFDHEIIDGAPAARFVSHFEQILSSGELMKYESNITV